jgi:hypothetical protein
MATGVVLGQGGIRHVVDGDGPAVDAAAPNHAEGMTAVARLLSWPA